ncbi:hypothetical protein BCR42DRAFT_402921, partial [Absidia repens]
MIEAVVIVYAAAAAAVVVVVVVVVARNDDAAEKGMTLADSSCSEEVQPPAFHASCTFV